MLSLQRIDRTGIVCPAMGDGGIEGLLDKEWLLTNERGSYCSSTAAGCHTRRYHGLLIGTLDPPANRINALSQCLEVVSVGGRRHILTNFEFGGRLADQAVAYLRQFRQGAGAHFEYEIDGVRLTRSVYLARRSDTVAITYRFEDVTGPVELEVRPLVGLRDFHGLQRSWVSMTATQTEGGIVVHHSGAHGGELFMRCEQGGFEADAQWWYDFLYRVDRERGQDCREDLWSPGVFRCVVERPGEVVFWANLSRRFETATATQFDVEGLITEVQEHRRRVMGQAKAGDRRLRRLFAAADAFIVRRTIGGRQRCTILAGYPWFMDWGRDTFISLRGLLLCTGRLEEAASVLTTFAAAADQGMIPNRFDDRSDTAHFNSVDASLWFIHAAFEYLEAGGDGAMFARELLPVIRWVLDSYERGTRFEIRADDDGLITAGTEQTQLTWMDAKCGDVVFTPRWGKAVEVNALWHEALSRTAQFYDGRNIENARRYRTMADRVAASFRRCFWNEQTGWLNDCVRDGAVDASLRPNQILAVSLSGDVLSAEQQRAVVDVVERRLLTPYGLRTLDPADPRYRGRYEGGPMERDGAYHQGTVWPWLMGPFVQAYLRVHGSGREARRRAARFIEPLMRHFEQDGCLGSVAEIFDADEPHRPRGCFAQAWSAASLITAYMAVKGS